MRTLRELLPPEVVAGCERVHQAARICELVGLPAGRVAELGAERELLKFEDPDDRAYIWDLDPEED